MINNEVREDRKVVGFRCHTCDQVKTKMWGTVCNECRKTRVPDVMLDVPRCDVCSTFLGASDRATCACGKYSW